jgi:hypothetical protein
MMLSVISQKIPNSNMRALTDLEILEVSGGRGIGRGSHRIRSQAGNGGLPTSCPAGQSMQLHGITVSTNSYTGSVTATVGVLPSGSITANSPVTTTVKSFVCAPTPAPAPEMPAPETSDKEQDECG